MARYLEKSTIAKVSAAASVLAIVIGTPALAAPPAARSNLDDQQRIEDIIVTAQKREQNVKDVPMSITAVSGASLENAGVQTVKDLSFAVPSLGVNELYPGVQVLTIRGVGNFRGSTALVGLFLDEIPLSLETFSLDAQVVDLARVEVLRGPQGTLYGQGSVGGTVRFLTNDPKFNNWEGTAGLTLYDTDGGDLSNEATGVLNIPVVTDRLAFRLSGTYKNKGGWIDQPLAGRKNINDNELYNVRLKGMLKVTDDLTVRATIVRHHDDGDATNNTNQPPYDQAIFQRAIDPTMPDGGYVNKYTLYNITGEYDFGFATLTSTSSWAKGSLLNRDYSQFLDFAPAAGGPSELLGVNQLRTVRSFVQEVRLSSNGNARLNWTAGVNYSNARTVFSADDFFLKLGAFGIIINPAHDVFIRNDRKSIALFGDVSYGITDKLRLGIGTRYYRDKPKVDSNNFPPDMAKFDKFSSRAYLSYAVVPEVTFYGSIAQGFRSGGFNTVAGATPYDPETVLAYEAGAKSSFLDGRLKAELSFFYNRYSHYLVTNIDPRLAVAVSTNAGTVGIKGFEWNVQAAPTNSLRLGFSGNYTHAEFNKLGPTVISNVVGDPVSQVPRYSIQLSGEYRFALSPAIPAYFRANYNRQGKVYDIDRGSGYLQPAYSIPAVGFADIHLGAAFGRLRAEVFSENLLNEHKLITASLSRLSGPHRPRTIGMKLDFDF